MIDLDSVFERHGDEVFLIDVVDEREWTYEQFRELASRVGSWLKSTHELAPGSRVGLLLDSSPELAALYFGCLAAGVIAVPMNPALRSKDLEFAARQSDLSLLFYSLSTSSIVESLDVPQISARIDIGRENGASFLDALPASERAVLRAEASPFSMTFTSGTTGQPKAVTHTSANLFGNALAFNEASGVRSDARFLHVMPMTYMAGILNTLIVPFMAGASVVVGKPFDARSALTFWRMVVRHEVTTMWLAPTMLNALIRLDRDEWGQAHARSHISGIWVGTAPLSASTQRQFEEKYGVPLFESYGLSELLIVSSDGPARCSVDGSVGWLLEGVEARINSDGDEIEVSTPFVCEEWAPEPANGSSLWSKTGDQGRLADDGRLHITGRLKDLIIRGGINISPRQIEEVLTEHPLVQRAAAVGVPHDFYGEEVVAVVQLSVGPAEPRTTSSELAKHCREHLSVPAVPSRFIYLDEFPASSTGKTDKVALRQLALGAT